MSPPILIFRLMTGSLFQLPTRWLLSICLGFLFLLHGSCRYGLGSGSELPYDNIHARVVRNDSFAPQAGPLLSRALREEIVREGSVRLMNNATDADAVLTVRLVDYERLPEVYRSDDTALASGFRMGLFALASLQSSSGKKVFFEDRLFRSGASTMRSNLTESPVSRQPMMAASRALAREIAATVSRVTW
ncbi:MAG: LPS assembly lipoprotein LptE [Opitutales bacterium]